MELCFDDECFEYLRFTNFFLIKFLFLSLYKHLENISFKSIFFFIFDIQVQHLVTKFIDLKFEEKFSFERISL